MSYLAQLCTFSKEIERSSDRCTTIIASHSQRNFQPYDELNFKESLRANSTDLVDAITVSCESLEIDDLKDLRILLALYVHPVVTREEIANSNFHLNAHYTSKEYRVAQAELRTIYTIFIMPQFKAELTGNIIKDGIMFQLLNSTFLIVTRELEKYHGHLRQFIIDDKGMMPSKNIRKRFHCTNLAPFALFPFLHCIEGVVLIATFGLRGSTCPNM